MSVLTCQKLYLERMIRERPKDISSTKQTSPIVDLVEDTHQPADSQTMMKKSSCAIANRTIHEVTQCNYCTQGNRDDFRAAADLATPGTEVDLLQPSTASLGLPDAHCSICHRDPSYVVCQSCGHVLYGRKREKCPEHPNKYLMDHDRCPKCKSRRVEEVVPLDTDPASTIRALNERQKRDKDL